MVKVVDPVQVLPGQDTTTYDATLQKGVAESLNELKDQNGNSPSTMPPQDQSPISDDSSQIMEKPGFEIDLDDTLAGQLGKPRSEPSQNFLQILLGRLKKKNPDSDIVGKEK